MAVSSCIFLVGLILLFALVWADDLVVEVQQGKVKGTLTKGSVYGNEYYSFLGIPFAKAPVGDLRFKDPVPADPWDGTLDASTEGPCCCLTDSFLCGNSTTSENCLNINVFIPPTRPDGTLKPVLFHIHGGALMFSTGGPSLYSPEFLMTGEDIIYVAPDFRLALAGYLYLKDPSLEVTGNAGFKDVVMALKWVRDNIRQFGGDPDSVTLLGESSGAVTANLLMVSEMASGLFHRAIIQSGSALVPWARGRSPLDDIARVTGRSFGSERELLDYLKGLSYHDLINLTFKVPWYYRANAKRIPGYIVDANAKSPFLTREPIDTILSDKSANIPVIFGYNEHESMIFELFIDVEELMRGHCENYLHYYLGYDYGSPETLALGEKIKQQYYKGKAPTRDNVESFYNLETDAIFLYGIYLSARHQVKHSTSPVYFYKMTIETSLNLIKSNYMTDLGLTKGASHGDDLGYIFKTSHTPQIVEDSVEDVAIKRFVKLWTNFVKTGDPTPDSNCRYLTTKWEPIDKSGDKVRCLDIGKELVMKEDLVPERMKFWNEIHANSPKGSKYVEFN